MGRPRPWSTPKPYCWQAEARYNARPQVNRDDLHFPPHHQPLRDDIHALGEVVGLVLREQGGAALFDLAEQDRRVAIARRQGVAGASEELRAGSGAAT